MKSRRSSSLSLCTLLVAGLALASCSDPERDRQSLREALAGLPQDTSTEVVEETEPEVEEVEPGLPVDTTLFGLFSDTALSDTADDVAEVVPTRDDSTGPRLRPGPPQDTAPWIPLRDTPTLSAEWTTEGRVSEASGEGTAVLENVRTARADGYDRIVFEFRSGRLPGYRIEMVEPPVRQCGSGQVVPLRGGAWLRVRFEPSQAHDERGRPTVQDRARSVDLPALREMRLICDYEGQVEWILGLVNPVPFRVTELSNPARVVVDVGREEEF